MTNFYPTSINDESFVRAPGRLLYAATSVTFPTQISDVLNLSSFAAAANWTDLGATKGGIQISFNNSEETFDVDQIIGDIDSLPNGSDMAVQTQLAEATLDHIAFAWEGDTVTTNTTPANDEKSTSIGPFETYTKRRLAMAQRRPSNGNIRLYVFRKVQRAAQESTLTANKTGEQQSIPVRFKVLPDTSVSTVAQRYCTIFDQIG